MPIDLNAMNWLNEPAHWSFNDGSLHVSTDASTDFWRITHYGFARDNGHFYYQVQSGDFEAGVCIIGQYRSRYDQAGLMIRVDAQHWIKTGIEYVDGIQQASAVVTRTFSDWSVRPYQLEPERIWLKLTRQRDFVEINISTDGQTFDLLRLAYFSPDIPLQVGPMCASPDGTGFEVLFTDFYIKTLLNHE
jgi:regulation of enolase protein 1 (concanavalin A-like superfamily)